MDITVKIDRITVSGKTDLDLASLKQKLQSLNYSGLYHWKDSGMGYFDLLRIDDDGMGENIAGLFPNPHQKNGWRLDSSAHFQNDTERDIIASTIAILDAPHFTRLDIAFDIFNSPYPNMAHELMRFNTSTRQMGVMEFDEIGSRARNVQTKYWGARKSEQQVRYYDKYAERNAKKHPEDIPEGVFQWERLELQLRGKKPEEWLKSAKDMLELFVLLDFNSITDPKTRGILASIFNPDVALSFSDFAEATAAKYRKIAKTRTKTNHVVADEAMKVLEANAWKLQDELNTYMNTWVIKNEF